MTKVLSVIACIAIIILATEDIGAAAAASKTVISFAGMNPRQAPLWIAQEQGLFAKNGIDSDVVFIRTGPIQVAAVSSGGTQLAYAGSASILAAAAGGADLRAIASFTNRLSYTLLARPDIKKTRRAAWQTLWSSSDRRVRVDGSRTRAGVSRSGSQARQHQHSFAWRSDRSGASSGSRHHRCDGPGWHFQPQSEAARLFRLSPNCPKPESLT